MLVTAQNRPDHSLMRLQERSPFRRTGNCEAESQNERRNVNDEKKTGRPEFIR